MSASTLRLGQLMLLVALVLWLIGAPPPASAGKSSDFVAGEVIVSLKDSAFLKAITDAYGLDPTPIDHFGANPIYQLRILDDKKPDRLAKVISNDPNVEYAEPNYINSVPSGAQRSTWAKVFDESAFATQWAAPRIGLSEAHRVTRGAGIIVAVLDTGIDASHPLFQGRLVPGYDFVDRDNNPQEVAAADPDSYYGHGTHVAGLIAMVAPEARLMPVRVLDENGMGNIWVLAKGLAFAVDPDGNPATDDGADVINLSLATTRKTQLLKDIVKALNCATDEDEAAVVQESSSKLKLPRCDRGVVVVAAAGNTGGDDEEFPAAEATKVKGAIAVAASTADDMLASFSTRGGWVRIMAPGDGIISSFPGTGYVAWSGTSMATPLVAGSAALVRAAYPELKADRVIKQLIKTARKIPGPAPDRLDAAAAVLISP